MIREYLDRDRDAFAPASSSFRTSTELRIGVLSANQPAARLYSRAGFAPYSEVLTKRLRPSADL
jgi:hypothetical protein